MQILNKFWERLRFWWVHLPLKRQFDPIVTGPPNGAETGWYKCRRCQRSVWGHVRSAHRGFCR